MSDRLDGQADASFWYPDDVSKPFQVLFDTNHDGKVDIIVEDTNRDGKWDFSYHDIDYDGTIDLAPLEAGEPVDRCASAAARRSSAQPRTARRSFPPPLR